jgi:LemA protein
MWIFLIVLVVAVLIAAFLLIGIYNMLVKLKNRYKNAFAQIEVQLKRRHDLIPNLVETAKGYIKHERETLEAVVKARGEAMQGLKDASGNPGDADKMKKLSGAEGMLSGALGRLFALSESYPDLKANQNMMQLSEELTSTENKVAFARQAYNDAVMAFNIYRQSFPAVVIAPLFGFDQDAGLLEFKSAEIAEPVKVEF